MISARIEALRQRLGDEELAGMLVAGAENRRYLSGFTGSAGVLIISRERRAIATDSRYYEQVKQQSPSWELIEADYDFDDKLPQYLERFGLSHRCVGYEGQHISVYRLHRWQAAVDDLAALVPTRDVVETLRQVKDPGELDTIKQAISIADAALEHIYGWLQPGLTERQVAWELERFMREHGADAVSFEIIAASGHNAALPHARPGERRIQAGEPIIMDLGCRVDGYCSDVTRTVCLGEPDDDQYSSLWQLVKRAQETAEAGLRAGMASNVGDALARDVINEAGFGQYFGHSLGHGVGLEIHERPRLSYASQESISAGSVVTVEPGIYLPGWGGIRIEDMVLVNEKGAEVLTAAPKIALL